MTVYRIRARSEYSLPMDWRERLATRLGGRPRRIGRWAELGLFGAMECLVAAEESIFPEQAALVLSSQHGPALAMREALVQARDGLPLPLTFLQIQPSQLLATLSSQLRWCGDARFISQPDPLAVLELALTMVGDNADGLLLGWVNELGVEGAPCDSSLWLRIEPATDPGGVWHPLSNFETLMHGASHLRQSPTGVAVIIKPIVVNAVQQHP